MLLIFQVYLHPKIKDSNLEQNFHGRLCTESCKKVEQKTFCYSVTGIIVLTDGVI